MKTISRIICCAVALVWMFSATAAEDAVDQGATGEDQATEVPAGDPSGNAAAASAAASSGASAADAVADAAQVPTPPAPRIPVAPYKDKVDRAAVEKRLSDRAARNEKRTAQAAKDAAEREAKRLGQTNTAPNNQ